MIESRDDFAYNTSSMAKVCDNCGKGIMIGHNVSHAKNRTRKIFKPNLHVSRVIFNGKLQRMKLCTKCLRLLKGKSQKDKVKSLKEEVISTSAPVAAGLA